MREFSAKKEELIKLDSKDKKILKVLFENARMPITEIAKKTKLPKDVVLYRINKYKKTGVVTFYSLINPSLMGYPIYKYVSITTFNFHPDKEKDFTTFLKNHPNITYSTKLSGKVDYLIAISAKSLKGFDQIMKEIRSKFNNIIKDFEINDIVEEYQHDYSAELIE